MVSTVREARWVTFYYGLQHMIIPVLADQQKTYIYQLCVASRWLTKNDSW